MLEKIIFLILPFLFFYGCGAEDMDPAEIAEYYETLDCLTAEASVVANTGVQTSYNILFTRSSDGDTVEILSPESLAGVTAKIYHDRAEVEYDGMAVETMLPGISGFVPADAISGAIEDLSGSVPEEYCLTEIDGVSAVAVTFVKQIEGTSARKTLFIDRNDMSLLGGEFYLGEMMIMELKVSSFLI